MTVFNEIIQDIGRTLLHAANDQNPDWDYVGYTFNTNDGVNFDASGFLFVSQTLQEFTLRRIGKDLGTLHLRLREITKIHDQPYWIASRCVLRKLDNDFKLHFEFDNPNRWKITPANADNAFDVLVGSAFDQ